MRGSHSLQPYNLVDHDQRHGKAAKEMIRWQVSSCFGVSQLDSIGIKGVNLAGVESDVPYWDVVMAFRVLIWEG
jgi:hypothetical protein